MLEELHAIPPYSLDKTKKREILSKYLIHLLRFHYNNCREYKNIIDALKVDLFEVKDFDLPFLPVRLFKEMDLMSIPRERIFKIMTSSGTTGQKVSKIYLDRDTALLQQKVLIRLLSDFVGKDRKPMLFIDTEAVVKDRNLFSARGAALLSINVLGRDIQYALNEDMSLNYYVVEKFLEKHKEKQIIVFGFTFMVWEHLYKALENNNRRIDLSNATLLQSGGWKKLQSQAVTREIFKSKLAEVCSLHHFSDHYGMAEQNGSVYVECKYGYYHTSNYSDVITRRHKDFSISDLGEKGIIQVVSCLPGSYPGHSLLTEDEGIILGEDDCACGRKGKYIQITGRVKRAEIRGCGDTYAVK